MKTIALTAMVLLIGLAQSGTVQADEEPLAPEVVVPGCSTNILTTGSCTFTCPEGYYIRWTGTSATTLSGFAECANQETPECNIPADSAPSCTRESPQVTDARSTLGKCRGTGVGFVSCESFLPQTIG